MNMSDNGESAPIRKSESATGRSHSTLGELEEQRRNEFDREVLRQMNRESHRVAELNPRMVHRSLALILDELRAQRELLWTLAISILPGIKKKPSDQTCEIGRQIAKLRGEMELVGGVLGEFSDEEIRKDLDRVELQRFKYEWVDKIAQDLFGRDLHYDPIVSFGAFSEMLRKNGWLKGNSTNARNKLADLVIQMAASGPIPSGKLSVVDRIRISRGVELGQKEYRVVGISVDKESRGVATIEALEELQLDEQDIYDIFSVLPIDRESFLKLRRRKGSQKA